MASEIVIEKSFQKIMQQYYGTSQAMITCTSLTALSFKSMHADREVTEVMEMSQNPVYSMSTVVDTTDCEAIQTCPNILYWMNTEVNHTHQYETVDTPIEMNQNPVYSATTATIESDCDANDDLGPTRNEHQLEYDYIQV